MKKTKHHARYSVFNLDPQAQQIVFKQLKISYFSEVFTKPFTKPRNRPSDTQTTRQRARKIANNLP